MLLYSAFSMHSSHSRTLAYLAKIQIALCSIVEHIVGGMRGTFGTQRHDVVCFIDPFLHSTSSVVHLRLILSGIFSVHCYIISKFIMNLPRLGLVEWHQTVRPQPSRLQSSGNTLHHE